MTSIYHLRQELYLPPILEYLDEMKSSGVIETGDMVSYLVNGFALTREEATTIIAYWMDPGSRKRWQE